MKVFFCAAPLTCEISRIEVLEGNICSCVLPTLMDDHCSDVMICAGFCSTTCHTSDQQFLYKLPQALTSLLDREMDNKKVLIQLLNFHGVVVSHRDQLDINVRSLLAIFAYLTAKDKAVRQTFKSVIDASAKACANVSWVTYASYFSVFHEPLASVSIPDTMDSGPWWKFFDVSFPENLRTHLLNALTHRLPRLFLSQTICEDFCAIAAPVALFEILDPTFACVAGGFAAAMGQCGHMVSDFVLPTSDVDIFLLGGCPDQVLTDILRWGVREAYTVCTKNAAVFVLVKPGHRLVQIISTNYESPETLIADFDYGYCQAYMDIKAGKVHYTAEALRDWISGVAHPVKTEGRDRKPARIIKALAKKFSLTPGDLDFLRSNVGDPESNEVKELIAQVAGDRIPCDFTRWTLLRFGLTPVAEPSSGWTVPVAHTTDPKDKHSENYQTSSDGSQIADSFWFRHSAESYVSTIKISPHELTPKSGFWEVQTDLVLRYRGRLVFSGLHDRYGSGFYINFGLENDDNDTIRKVFELVKEKLSDQNPPQGKRHKASFRSEDKKEDAKEKENDTVKLWIDDNARFYENGRLIPPKQAIKTLTAEPTQADVLLRPYLVSQEDCQFKAQSVSWISSS